MRSFEPAQFSPKDILTSALPVYARPFVDVILKVSSEQGLDPSLVFALGDQESQWGSSSFLDKPGPAGRGDKGALFVKVPFTKESVKPVPAMVAENAAKTNGKAKGAEVSAS